MRDKRKLTDLLGIAYPIIQGPFGGGLSSVELASTVSNYGALGSFGGQPYTADELVEICSRLRQFTDKPFNINLWVGDRDKALTSFSDEDYNKLVKLFKPYFEELGLPLPERN